MIMLAPVLILNAFLSRPRTASATAPPKPSGDVHHAPERRPRLRRPGLLRVWIKRSVLRFREAGPDHLWLQPANRNPVGGLRSSYEQARLALRSMPQREGAKPHTCAAGDIVTVPTLILLGAAGGALRGLLDVYTRFLDWQSDRRAHRRLPPGQDGEPPQFQQYFDPVGDPVAAVVHSGMGAGAAVLFGSTGQINGAYAAIVVGISAPVILTQLSRVQSVSDALTAGPRRAWPPTPRFRNPQRTATRPLRNLRRQPRHPGSRR